jgi:hypothetical protein
MIQDILDYHSGVIDAAETASRVGARAPGPHPHGAGPEPRAVSEWIERAAQHYDGEIVIGDDLTTITI